MFLVWKWIFLKLLDTESKTSHLHCFIKYFCLFFSQLMQFLLFSWKGGARLRERSALCFITTTNSGHSRCWWCSISWWCKHASVAEHNQPLRMTLCTVQKGLPPPPAGRTSVSQEAVDDFDQWNRQFAGDKHSLSVSEGETTFIPKSLSMCVKNDENWCVGMQLNPEKSLFCLCRASVGWWAANRTELHPQAGNSCRIAASEAELDWMHWA